ncbi:Leucine-rich repeat protein [Mycoemilia scoparia]|uniref:Leucine-rich repeat protein n=1 Tax=Mycoemilia scoparia TaxID=417184 RepID=A0A9W8A8X2_9FUNG|nr:Leucine-rich repeat protein [Mycoemilia scoparia]
MSFAKKRPEALMQPIVSEDGQTFQVNANAPKDSLLPTQEFNGMFSPLSIERIFYQEMTKSDKEDSKRDNQTDTLIKLLWKEDDDEYGPNGPSNIDTHSPEDDTLKQIISGERKMSDGRNISTGSSVKFPDLAATYGQESSRRLVQDAKSAATGHRSGHGRRQRPDSVPPRPLSHHYDMSALANRKASKSAESTRPESLVLSRVPSIKSQYGSAEKPMISESGRRTSPILKTPTTNDRYQQHWLGVSNISSAHRPATSSPLSSSSGYRITHQEPPQSARISGTNSIKHIGHSRSNSTDTPNLRDSKNNIHTVQKYTNISSNSSKGDNTASQNPLGRVRGTMDYETSTGSSNRKRATTMPSKPNNKVKQKHGTHHRHQRSTDAAAAGTECEPASVAMVADDQGKANSSWTLGSFSEERSLSPKGNMSPGLYDCTQDRGHNDSQVWNNSQYSLMDNSCNVTTPTHMDKCGYQSVWAENHDSAYEFAVLSTEQEKPRNSDSMSKENQDNEQLDTVLHCLNPNSGTALHQLTSINLSGCGIHHLKGLSTIAPSLDSINLNCNKITSLEGLPSGTVVLSAATNWISSPHDENGNIIDPEKPYLYANFLPHLEHVDLSDNQITDISVFSGSRHLRTLIVNKNRLTSLAGLQRCPRLETLKARENVIKKLDVRWGEFPELSTLDLYRNRIKVLGSIEESHKLRTLNLESNDLEGIHIMRTIHTLRVLRLSENTRLFRNAHGAVDIKRWVECFPGLKTLYLDGCQAKYLGCSNTGEKVSSPWPSLYNLSVRGQTGAGDLTLDLTCLRNLRNLYVSKQQVSLPRALPALPHLVQLELVNSGLTRLPPNLSSATLRLELLDISNNPDLVDLSPIYYCQSLKILRCRSTGWRIGGEEGMSGGSNDGSPNKDSGNYSDNAGEVGRAGCGAGHSYATKTIPPPSGQKSQTGVPTIQQLDRYIQALGKLQQLSEIDLRFNPFNRYIYAHSNMASAPIVDGASSPAMISANTKAIQNLSKDMAVGRGSSGSISGGSGSLSRNYYQSASSSLVGFNEEAWRRKDFAYIKHLKLTNNIKALEQRERYCATILRQFPRIKVLDGCPLSTRKPSSSSSVTLTS